MKFLHDLLERFKRWVGIEAKKEVPPAPMEDDGHICCAGTGAPDCRCLPQKEEIGDLQPTEVKRSEVEDEVVKDVNLSSEPVEVKKEEAPVAKKATKTTRTRKPRSSSTKATKTTKTK